MSGIISAADATTIPKTPMPEDSEAVKATYEIKDGWGVLTERFNWGATSRPDKVYYELWQEGQPMPDYIEMPMWRHGFYCGSKIRESNIDNVCTHIFAADRIHVKLWNCSDPAEDVYYDFCVWYYTFAEEYAEEVLEILMKDIRLLERIHDLLRAEVALRAEKPLKEVTVAKLQNIVEEVLEKRLPR